MTDSQRFTSVNKALTRGESNPSKKNPYASTALNYASDIIQAYGYRAASQVSVAKIGLQIERDATLFDRVTSRGLPYFEAMRELGFTKDESLRSPTIKEDRRGDVNEVKKVLGRLPTNYQDYNTVSVKGTRGAIVPTHLFFSSRLSLDDFLFFQYNPSQYLDKKETKLDESQYLGYGASREVWVSGGRRVLSFDLFFDATRASMDERDLFITPLPSEDDSRPKNTQDLINQSISTDPHSRIEVSKEGGSLVAVNKLQSYQYPVIEKNDLASVGRPRFLNGVFEPARRFESVPVLLLILGKQVYQGRVASVEANHVLMNKDFIPIRSTCKISFIVDEWDVHSDVSTRIVEQYNTKLNDLQRTSSIF